MQPEDKLLIIQGLLKLRQAGKLQGVWYCEGDSPQVRWVGVNAPETISWREAADMVGFVPAVPAVREQTPFRKTLRPMRKQPQSVIITVKKDKTA